MTLVEELVSVLRALEGARVDHALVGGLAVAVWGAPRATKDIDLLVRREALPAAKDAIRPLGYTLEALPFEFNDGTEMCRVNKVDDAGRLMTVDFMIVNASLEAVWSSRMRLPFAEGQVVVAGREALMDMKTRAARPQDLADVRSLAEIDR